MEYPHNHVGHVGHHRHHNNRREDDDDFNSAPPPPPPVYGDEYNQPPPPSYGAPSYGNAYDQPPPTYGGSYNQPPPSYGGGYDQPPPQQPSYSHHEGGYDGGSAPAHHGFKPHMPDFHHHGGPQDHGSSAHNYGGGPDVGPEMGYGGGPELGHLANKPSHKIECKAGGDRYVFGIRDGKVILTHPDSSDLTQHWYRDEKYSIRVKDKEGHPSFMLVNKGTGQAVKHSISCQPVQLTPYKPDALDESVLWTESKDLGSGYRTVRTVNNIHLVMDAWNADKDHGGIHDGTVIALYETWKGDNQNQQWKFIRH
ncbi:ricin B-like lectin EULS3 [Silene latifolia]|uniref:ricin B-like lectin EULS3 n=1 Tax=Silene latifolia TaxID=37657 RepID=UPI003D77BBF1